MARFTHWNIWYELVTLICIIMVTPNIEGSPRFASESEFVEHLLKNYRGYGRPGPLEEPVKVFLELNLINLDEFNEREQYITTLCWFRERWKDESLSWNTTEVPLTAVSVTDDVMWRPDIVVRNSMSEVYGDIMDKNRNFKTRIFSDGTVQLLTAGKISTACIVDMTYFPFDKQACYILFDSWSYSITEIRLMEYDLGAAFNMDSYRQNGQWRVTNHYSDIRTTLYNDTQQTFDEVRFVMEFERKPEFYLLNIVAPCVIMSFMVILVFLVPVDSGEKVSLCITLFLAYSVFQLVVADHMPRSSDHYPILALYFTSSMVLAGLSLLATLLVLNLHHHGLQRRPPRRLRHLVNGRLPTLLGLPPPPSGLSTDPPTDKQSNGLQKLLIGKNSNDETEGSHDEQVTAMVELNGAAEGELGELQTEVARMRRSLQDLRGVLTRVGEHRAPGGQEGEEDPGREVWAYVARVMDRVFLLLFAVATALVAIILLGLFPLGRPENVQPVDMS